MESRIWCCVFHKRQADFEVSKFEVEFARYQDAKYACAVTNGTAALEVALRAGGIQPGDEVIVQAASFIATAMAVSYVGAIPVFVDIDPETYAISREAIQSAITAQTRAIIPVHLGGMPPIWTISAR